MDSNADLRLPEWKRHCSEFRSEIIRCSHSIEYTLWRFKLHHRIIQRSLFVDEGLQLDRKTFDGLVSNVEVGDEVHGDPRCSTFTFYPIANRVVPWGQGATGTIK